MDTPGIKISRKITTCSKAEGQKCCTGGSPQVGTQPKSPGRTIGSLLIGTSDSLLLIPSVTFTEM